MSRSWGKRGKFSLASHRPNGTVVESQDCWLRESSNRHHELDRLEKPDENLTKNLNDLVRAVHLVCSCVHFSCPLSVSAFRSQRRTAASNPLAPPPPRPLAPTPQQSPKPCAPSPMPLPFLLAFSPGRLVLKLMSHMREWSVSRSLQ